MEQLSTMACYMMAQANRGNEAKVFDWDTAAKIIKERKPVWAQAGLKGDFGNTGGAIYGDGEPIDTDYTYLSSIWATPVLVLFDGEREEDIPCYKLKHETDWGASTKWPISALKILQDE